MARKKKEDNIVTLPPESPPPPLFLGEKERNFVKQVNDEIIERVVGQEIIYYPMSREDTNYHPVYGEAVQKTFLAPVKVNALVEWEGSKTNTEIFGVDRLTSITIKFHRRRLIEDQNLYVREGDFVLFGQTFYEIVTLNEAKILFGQIGSKFEVLAKCIKARESMFNSK